MRSAVRVFAVAVLLPWLAVAAVCARAHVHESEEIDHPAVAHQHFAPHEGRADHVGSTHHETEIADPDERIVWLDEVGLAETPRSFPTALPVISAPKIAVPVLITCEAAAVDEATLPHGPPPIVTSPRGPPSTSFPI